MYEKRYRRSLFVFNLSTFPPTECNSDSLSDWGKKKK